MWGKNPGYFQVSGQGDRQGGESGVMMSFTEIKNLVRGGGQHTAQK